MGRDPAGVPLTVGRRAVLGGLAGSALWSASARAGLPVATLPFANGERPIVRYPQKRPMLQLTARPPQLETPFEVFGEGLLTPNDAFFVRYHLADLPLTIDPGAFRLTIGGQVERALSLSLAELKRDFPASEVIAVNQCSGNGRGFFAPRVGGGQLGNGAMGNARWRGVPLSKLLDRAGVKAGAVQVSFNGLDRPPAETVPDFVKALPIDHARDGEVLVAWSMNGADLPFLNGYPLRLVVPGYYGTYWVKHLNDIQVLDHAFDGYWMKTAYRVPDNDCTCVPPGTKPAQTRPISKLNVRSFLTSHAAGATVHAERKVVLRGIAFDGGAGIERVSLSTDAGATWNAAALEPEMGRYSFRGWKSEVSLPKGAHDIQVRAFARDGSSQPLTALWQPTGYMRNVVETVRVNAL